MKNPLNLFKFDFNLNANERDYWNAGQYSLPVGVFLFIGYSKADERAMYHFTNLNISKHLLSRLQKLIESLGEPVICFTFSIEFWRENSWKIFLFSLKENECRISIHEQADENIILQIRLADLDVQRANESVTLEMLTVEKVSQLNSIHHNLINIAYQIKNQFKYINIIKLFIFLNK